MVQDIKTELENIYTPLEDAKEEVMRRWNDKLLRKKVDDFLRNDIPDFFKETPRAILARFILSPNFETFRFLELSEMAGLKPLCLEYLDDKFVAENIDKYYLCKMFFYGGAGRNGGINLSTMKVINFNDSQGKRIGGLETVGGNSLENFHHKLSSDLN